MIASMGNVRKRQTHRNGQQVCVEGWRGKGGLSVQEAGASESGQCALLPSALTPPETSEVYSFKG